MLELYPYIIREKVTKTKFVENPLESKYEAFWKKSWGLTTNQNRATICTYYEEIHTLQSYLRKCIPNQIGCIFGNVEHEAFSI